MYNKLPSTVALSLPAGDADYIELVAVVVTFQPGDSSQASVPLLTLSDNVPAEGDETLRAALTVSSNNFDPSRINLLVPQANVTITEEIGKRLFTSILCIHVKLACYKFLFFWLSEKVGKIGCVKSWIFS